MWLVTSALLELRPSAKSRPSEGTRTPRKMVAASRIREATRPSASPSFCFLSNGNRTTAVPMPARATMISRTPPNMAPSIRSRADDVVRALYGSVEDDGRDRDKGDQIEDARRERDFRRKTEPRQSYRWCSQALRRSSGVRAMRLAVAVRTRVHNPATQELRRPAPRTPSAETRWRAVQLPVPARSRSRAVRRPRVQDAGAEGSDPERKAADDIDGCGERPECRECSEVHCSPFRRRTDVAKCSQMFENKR